MIDITKIQPFDVPPEITALKSENIHLTKENKSLLKQTNIIIGAIVFSLLFGILAFYQPKKNEDEYSKKNI